MNSDRAAASSRCAICPKGNKVVVVGVITSKFGELEKKDDIKRRLEEAAKFAPLDQLAVSPQCGFASTEEGNVLSEEEQSAKLSLAVEVAERGVGEMAACSSSFREPRSIRADRMSNCAARSDLGFALARSLAMTGWAIDRGPHFSAR